MPATIRDPARPSQCLATASDGTTLGLIGREVAGAQANSQGLFGRPWTVRGATVGGIHP